MKAGAAPRRRSIGVGHRQPDGLTTAGAGRFLNTMRADMAAQSDLAIELNRERGPAGAWRPNGAAPPGQGWAPPGPTACPRAIDAMSVPIRPVQDAAGCSRATIAKLAKAAGAPAPIR
jgi:hypothetical protein